MPKCSRLYPINLPCPRGENLGAILVMPVREHICLPTGPKGSLVLKAGRTYFLSIQKITGEPFSIFDETGVQQKLQCQNDQIRLF